MEKEQVKLLLQIGMLQQSRRMSLTIAILATLLLVVTAQWLNGVVALFCVGSWWLQGKSLERLMEQGGLNEQDLS
jgi:hypothetical protein